MDPSALGNQGQRFLLYTIIVGDIFNYFIDILYMKKCTTLYKSKKMQATQKNAFQKWAKKIIQSQGGLPANAWSDFKKGFKRGVMKTCKAYKKNSNR